MGNSVLVVEDSRAVCSFVRMQIESLGSIKCHTAPDMASAKQALEADADSFYVAICDLNLPDAPNGEVVELVQSYGIPVIILTSSVDAQKREQLFSRQVADYIEKNHMAGVSSAVALVERMYANRDHSVLVVDDSAAQRDYLCALLHNRGYQTLQADDGEQGLKVLKANPAIRVVVTDYNMPGMDGLEMVREMRNLRSAQDLAIIGVSSVTEKGVLARFLKSGANDFLSKPFELEELYCRIDQNFDVIRYIHSAWEAANRDSLTGLYNRRYFFEHAAKLHAEASQGKFSITLAMVDADHFKKVNDTFGHQVGDEALVAIAGVLKRSKDTNALFARFGGEEFVWLCVHQGDCNACPALELLRADIESLQLQAPDGSVVPLSVSIGATTTLSDSFEAMLHSADEALYQAKEQGRNRVVFRNT